MSASRDRKQAAKKLGIALGAQCRRMLEAVGEEEIVQTSTQCGQLFLDNMEFIVWCLKEYGGVDQMPFERRKAPVGFNGHRVNGSVDRVK